VRAIPILLHAKKLTCIAVFSPVDLYSNIGCHPGNCSPPCLMVPRDVTRLHTSLTGHCTCVMTQLWSVRAPVYRLDDLLDEGCCARAEGQSGQRRGCQGQYVRVILGSNLQIEGCSSGSWTCDVPWRKGALSRTCRYSSPST
jgi:hypothetical protein